MAKANQRNTVGAKATAKTTRTPLVDAPKPGADPRGEPTEEELQSLAAQQVGVSAASAPTPTNESLYTANDAPGAGGLPAGAVMPQPRVRVALKSEKVVKVSVPKSFNLTTDEGSMVRYEAGTESMLEEHATHWYAKANGVEVL